MKLPILIFLTASSLHAQELRSTTERAPEARDPSNVNVIERTTKANEKAQKRQYPGGRDEQDLKVQASLPQPPRSLDGVVPGEVQMPDDHD